MGVVLTFLVVTFSAWRVSLLNIVTAMRDLPRLRRQRPRLADLVRVCSCWARC